MIVATSVERLPAFDGVCPSCDGEGDHLPDCTIAIEEAAESMTVAEAEARRDYSCGFWAGLDVPAVRFWNAVITARKVSDSLRRHLPKGGPNA